MLTTTKKSTSAPPQTPKKIELVTWDCHSITTKILLRNELKIALIKDVRNYILMAEW